jgi:hypothetical protein
MALEEQVAEAVAQIMPLVAVLQLIVAKLPVLVEGVEMVAQTQVEAPVETNTVQATPVPGTAVLVVL